MLQTLDADELLEWEEFYAEEPWGYEPAAFGRAQIAATVANTIPRKRGSKPFRASDFYHAPWAEVAEGLTPEQRAFIDKRKAKAKAKNGKRR